MNSSTASTIPDPPLGTIVELSSGIGTGVVRFNGYTDFKPGKWVGVELFEKNGKNDGSVGGVRYFSCKGGMGYGVFVRGSQIKRIVGNEREKEGERKMSVSAARRPTLGHQRTSSIGNGLGTAPSSSASSTLRVSPASASGSSRSTSPAKPSSSRLSPTKKSSLSLSSTTLTRPGHQARRSISLKQAPSPSSPNPPRVSSPLTKTPSPVPTSATVALVSEPPTSSLSPPTTAPEPEPPRPSITLPDTHPQIHALLTKIRVLETNRTLDTLQIQSLESKLAESSSFLSLRPKLQAKLQSQQTELTSLKQEINELKAQVKVWEERKEVVEGELEMCMLDKEMAEERAEIAVGELEAVKERLAEVEVEVEVLREEKELWELENDGEIKPEGKQKDTNTLAYVQLEKQNERLKEALLRLRDMTQDTDQDQRRRIAEMEKDLTGYEELQAQLSTTTVKLSNAETQIDDLKLQLDDALGAEDMLVQLTERNLVLGEKIEEMRITIEDLEALKELSDELEENHIETEKALQGDLETLSTQLSAAQLKISTLSDTCSDYEGTIGQFRDLVVQLQGELTHLRLTTASAESQRGEALSQTAAILSANIRLQSTAAKTRARDVEAELSKMRERELREELEIVEGFLPGVYRDGVAEGEADAGNNLNQNQTHKHTGSSGVVSVSGGEIQDPSQKPTTSPVVVTGGTDRDAVRVYMFFQRIASKADIINRVVAQTHGLPEALDLGGGEDDAVEGVEGKVVTELLVGVCEMRGRLSVLSTLCKRLSAILRRCSPELWISVGRLYEELKPLEKRMDIHVELLGRDEFRERECVSDVIKINAQFNHLAEMYFGDYFGGQLFGYVSSSLLFFHSFTHINSPDIAERELGTLTLFDLDLDMFAASIGMMKTSVEGLLKEEEFAPSADFGGFDIHTELYTPLLTLLSRSKSVKTSVRKMAKRLEELASSTPTSTSTSGANAALKPHLLPQMEVLSNAVQELVNFGISLAQQTLPYLADVRAGKTTPFRLTEILGFAKQQAGGIVVGGGGGTTGATTTTTAVAAKPMLFKPGMLWWEVVGDIITNLIEDSARLLPQTLDPANVLFLSPSTTTTAMTTTTTVTASTNPATPSFPSPPWISRIQTVQTLLTNSLSSTYNHLISQLQSDLLSLSRTLKAKDQHLAELTVKIQLLERRAEGKGAEVRRMEEMVKEMEAEVGRLRKVEAGYGEAMVQMQGEVEGLEREVERLRGRGNVVEGGGEHVKGIDQDGLGVGGSGLISAGVTATEGNLDHAQLMDQYTALRNTVRFLRTENAYLRGYDLIREIQALPLIPVPRSSRPSTPALDPSGLSDTDTDTEGDEEYNDPASLKKSSSSQPLPLLTETKLVYRSVMKYTSSPRVVDLSEVNARRLEVSRRRGLRLQKGRKNGQIEMREDGDMEEVAADREKDNDVLEGEGIKDAETGIEKLDPIGSTAPEIPRRPSPSGVWMPRKRMPAHQVLERKIKGERLGERVRGLMERVERASVVRVGGGV
ncbi:dynein associated protein-domain-containing protein [Lentinula edodes]|uniref:Dynein associated protein-domain-containing protein n=1 Tax=Lentinula lateritia TaxID=40482 RepID=A0A9W9AWT0_9AGAR|nr:dynein associated protein-domain-containing protein [Lentinula edodes]